ncbi:Phytochelatin-domain-containing protein [Ascodesmis nigricans]|uniref:glutathione gamma-glutamylcysteinyltransferase n=1 Tax=Ascodesmis nigricans TaxID=341454 RepID=A0A4S2N4B2_9PEZI|nr:Phytochelatin-domain-containing protein [Ascodesmis nigricans]
MFNTLRRSAVQRSCRTPSHHRTLQPNSRLAKSLDITLPRPIVEIRRSQSSTAATTSTTIPGLYRTASTTSLPTVIPSPPPPPSMAMARPTSSFYMRKLPSEKLVGYETPEGKTLFRHALEEANLEAFFPLSQQFLTQNEPAYCGIGTLCMILNALKVDPGVVWKGPWRWFSEDMLDCCRPLEWVKTNGITLSEFSCLARCNGLEAETRFADQITFEQFEQDVIACCRSESQFMAVSYSRRSLGQTGSGHFSPVGGYSSKNGGMVLILDVARFKYPSYWVPIRLLFESLIPIDTITGQPRGYSVLRRPRRAVTVSALLTLNATTGTWPTIYKPLIQLGRSAETYTELLESLCGTLGEPTGLPAVISRFEEHRSKAFAYKAGASPPLTVQPAEGLRAQADYKSRVESLHQHITANCKLYQTLQIDELAKVEMTVFLLALFSLEDFLAVLKDNVRAEVRSMVELDLRDARIRAEVGGVVQQMGGLVTCGREEACCKVSDGGERTCCAK